MITTPTIFRLFLSFPYLLILYTCRFEYYIYNYSCLRGLFCSWSIAQRTFLARRHSWPWFLHPPGHSLGSILLVLMQFFIISLLLSLYRGCMYCAHASQSCEESNFSFGVHSEKRKENDFDFLAEESCGSARSRRRASRAT